MADEWLTYQDLAERLGVSPEAARQKAIRGRWARRTANDGKAQVRVDVEDVKASTPVRKPKDEAPPDTRSPPVEQPVEHALDTQTLAALEAHIDTLKAMAAKAEAIAVIERERASNEQARADRERDRADAERVRVDALLNQIDSVRREEADKRAPFERNLAELQSVVDGLRHPWWKRLVG